MAANKSIIDSSDPGIVAKEMPIHLSDEKLKNLLSSTYERAQNDEATFKFYNHYGPFLSISGTLFLTLLTSSFNSMGQLKAATISIIAILLCATSGICGFILMAISVSKKKKTNTENRDKAVKEILSSVIGDDELASQKRG